MTLTETQQKVLGATRVRLETHFSVTDWAVAKMIRAPHGSVVAALEVLSDRRIISYSSRSGLACEYARKYEEMPNPNHFILTHPRRRTGRPNKVTPVGQIGTNSYNTIKKVWRISKICFTFVAPTYKRPNHPFFKVKPYFFLQKAIFIAVFECR